MKQIDLETWDRAAHYLFFRRMDYPHYHIGTDLDITQFRVWVKAQALPFSFAMTWAVTCAMNEVEALRYRILEGEVVLHEQVHPSFAYLAHDSKYFKMVTVDLGEGIHDFCKRAHEKAHAQQEPFVMEDVAGRGDLVYISSIPRVQFTHLSHTISLQNRDDAVPRLSWGKYFERDGRVLIPFNVQVHHGFVDGDHLGAYIEALQAYLDNPS